MVEEILANVPYVIGSSFLETAKAGGGEDRQHAAAVFCAAFARDEPTLHQPVEPAGETTRRES